MIFHVRGVVVETTMSALVIEVGGVGLALSTTVGTASAARVGDVMTVATSLVVRDDSLTLFGFGSSDERHAFELVQQASGIGPKVALAIVNTLSPAQLRAAILREDLNALCKVPGIGRKGAQKLVLELKDKITQLSADETQIESTEVEPAWRAQLIDGLQGLGWTLREAISACDGVADLAKAHPTPSVGTLMKAALASMAAKGR